MAEAVVWSFAGAEVFCLTVLRREPIAVSWSVQVRKSKSDMLTLKWNGNGLMREIDCVLIYVGDGMQQRQWTTANDETLKVMRRTNCQGDKVRGIQQRISKHSQDRASMQQRNI